MKKIILAFCLATTSMIVTSFNNVIVETYSPNNNNLDVGLGLKEALKVGTEIAVSKLNITDGYFKDQAVKILLPNELQASIDKFKSKSFKYSGVTITGKTLYETGYPALGIKPMKSKEDELILGMNRAAESAVKDAKPIFVNAITSMSIQDANGLLFGGDTAATNYLRQKTFSQLFTQFEPKMDAALKTVKVGDKSVTTVYESFITDYNKILSTQVASFTGKKSIASLMGMSTVKATNLSEYSTNKGLNGLFIKVKDQEANIRNNPAARVTSILKDVFGKLDK